MKKQSKKSMSSRAVSTAANGSTATRFIKMVESQFNDFPQIESVLLQGVAVACRSAIEFLDDLETQLSDKIVGLKKASAPQRRPRRIESIHEHSATN